MIEIFQHFLYEDVKGSLPDPTSDYIYVDGNGVDYMAFKDLDDSPKFNFTYTPLDYDNYDVDEFGNLDLTNSLTEGSKGCDLIYNFTKE